MARPIDNYLDRLGDLNGTPVVIVVTGFNYTERATKHLRDRVTQAHGTVADEIELWTARPNAARHGTTEPAQIMLQAGARIASSRAPLLK